ncbi:MAG: TVP38/TMEM64 family protein [Nannocystaceae bacterium]|nr:TVP38/TMEM64 family protein [Nannocystaceae bacterium]
MDGSPRTHRIVRVVIGVALLAAAVGVVVSGAYKGVSPESIRAALLDSDPWGPLLFVAAFALLQPFGFASHVFVIGASLVWSPWVALGLSWAGAVGAGCVAFGFARYMGRGWVQKRLPDKLAHYDERLANHGFRTVLIMRLMLYTFGPMQLMFGVSRVRFVPFVFGSALGLIPMLAIETWLGGNVVDWFFG